MKLITGGLYRISSPGRNLQYWWLKENEPTRYSQYLIRREDKHDFIIVFRLFASTSKNEKIFAGPFPDLKSAELALRVITS